MDFDEILLCQVVASQKHRHILPLITLQLDDLAKLSVLHHIAVAAELCTAAQFCQGADRDELRVLAYT